jgi:hypothetical protein
MSMHHSVLTNGFCMDFEMFEALTWELSSAGHYLKAHDQYEYTFCISLILSSSEWLKLWKCLCAQWRAENPTCLWIRQIHFLA